jgi:hypothetical protein
MLKEIQHLLKKYSWRLLSLRYALIFGRKYVTHPSQDQAAVFVFQLSKVDVEALDIHLLMFHILKVRIDPRPHRLE